MCNLCTYVLKVGIFSNNCKGKLAIPAVLNGSKPPVRVRLCEIMQGRQNPLQFKLDRIHIQGLHSENVTKSGETTFRKPTYDQQAILDASGRVVRIKARAGTDKTTALLMLAQKHRDRVRAGFQGGVAGKV